MNKPHVHPEVIRYLESRIPSLELESADDDQSLMARAQKRAGMLELLTIVKSLAKDN